MSNVVVVPARMRQGDVKRILGAYRAQGGNQVTVEPHLQVFEREENLERECHTCRIVEYFYASNDAAFDVACVALKELI